MSGVGLMTDALRIYCGVDGVAFVGLEWFAVAQVRSASGELVAAVGCGLLFGHSLQEGFEGYNGGKYQSPPLSFLKAFKTAAMLIICAAWSSFA